MSEINKEACLKLANYLETKVEGKKDFDMGVLTKEGDPHSKKAKEVCGTVACAIGFAPMLFKPIPADYSDSYWPVFQYTNFCLRVLGIEWGNREWDWCFNTCWAAVDNTAKGAASRIRYMLEHGVPDDFDLDVLEWDEDWKVQDYVFLYTKGSTI